MINHSPQKIPSRGTFQPVKQDFPGRHRDDGIKGLLVKIVRKGLVMMVFELYNWKLYI